MQVSRDRTIPELVAESRAASAESMAILVRYKERRLSSSIALSSALATAVAHWNGLAQQPSPAPSLASVSTAFNLPSIHDESQPERDRHRRHGADLKDPGSGISASVNDRRPDMLSEMKNSRRLMRERIRDASPEH
jgi:hypothetical protein